MSDLLSPSESQEFHSFLSSIATNDRLSGPSTSQWSPYPNVSQEMMPEHGGKPGEDLTKRTRDLISLGSSIWPSSSAGFDQYQDPQRSYSFGSQNQPSQRPQYGYDTSQSDPNLIFQHNHHRQPIPDSNFAYVSKQNSPQPPSLNHPHSDPSGSSQSRHVAQPITVPSMHTGTSDSRGMYLYSAMNSPPSSSSASVSASTSTYSFGDSSNGISSSTSISPTPSSDSFRAPTSSEKPCNKRSLDPSYSSSNKRSRPSPPSTSEPTAQNKSSLLSPSQKKANHIQSEQKRRANIRRGYEALCETVPALREAIRLEEEAQRNLQKGDGKGTKPKRGRGRGKIDEGSGEKIDGRAGPRSENIVLGKTIEYINELLDDRQSLLARLDRVRSSLSPNHPARMPPSTQPLWERQWKGGSGKNVDGEEDEEEDEDD